jgi:hypothetical protein
VTTGPQATFCQCDLPPVTSPPWQTPQAGELIVKDWAELDAAAAAAALLGGAPGPLAIRKPRPLPRGAAQAKGQAGDGCAAGQQEQGHGDEGESSGSELDVPLAFRRKHAAKAAAGGGGAPGGGGRAARKRHHQDALEEFARCREARGGKGHRRKLRRRGDAAGGEEGGGNGGLASEGDEVMDDVEEEEEKEEEEEEEEEEDEEEEADAAAASGGGEPEAPAGEPLAPAPGPWTGARQRPRRAAAEVADVRRVAQEVWEESGSSDWLDDGEGGGDSDDSG